MQSDVKWCKNENCDSNHVESLIIYISTQNDSTEEVITSDFGNVLSFLHIQEKTDLFNTVNK